MAVNLRQYFVTLGSRFMSSIHLKSKFFLCSMKIKDIWWVDMKDCQVTGESFILSNNHIQRLNLRLCRLFQGTTTNCFHSPCNKQDDHFRKIPQKSLVIKQFSSYRLIFWHANGFTIIFYPRHTSVLFIVLKNEVNDILYISVVCIKP